MRTPWFALLCLAPLLPACLPADSRTETVAAAALSCVPQTLSRLYFGLDSPHGPVTDTSWQGFVADDVSPRLPAGFTQLDARGQWRDDAGVLHSEASRVIEVVAADGLAHRQALAEIAGRYKQRFAQQSVLVTQSPTRACW